MTGLDLLVPARRALATVAGLSFAVNLLALVPALFMLQVFDRVLVSGSRETLVALLIGAFVALGLMFALDHLRSRLQGVAGNLVGDSLLPRVAREVLARRAGGKAASTHALQDVATLRGLFGSQALLAMFDAPWIVIYVLVIALAHPLLGAAALLASLLMLALALVNDSVTRVPVERLTREAGSAQRELDHALAHAETAESMGMASALLERWQTRALGVHALQSEAAGRSVALAALARATRQGIQMAMLAVGAWLVITQAASPGMMVATTILLGRALAPVEQIVASWKLLAQGRGAMQRLSELAVGPVPVAAGLRLPAASGALHVGGLTWRVPGQDTPILAGVGFELKAGEALAVIGPSGAGKSTLLRLLAGLWQPSAGSVRLDGADIANWSRDLLGPQLGYVPQEVVLFHGTVAENIARMAPQPVDSTVIAAARAAGGHELVLSLPLGYDTRIEPGSALLSPGQRQRIALARALYGEPRLLLLDEPNSNLDGAGEQALATALAALRGRVTIVMVTHRSTLLSSSDRLLVLERGQIRHFGSVTEVTRAMHQTSAQVLAMPRHVAAAGDAA